MLATSTPPVSSAADPAAPPAPPASAADQDRASRTRSLLLRAHEATCPRERDDLRHQVVLLNGRVAEAVAARYRRRGVPDEDLEQAAYEGLVKAVARFDPTLRHDLLSFAVPTVRGEVQRYFRDHSWVVRPPRRLQELQWQVNRSAGELAGELGREPTDAEIQDRVGLTPQEHGEVLESFGCFQPISLDQPLGGSPDLTVGGLVPDPSPEHDALERRMLLEPALAALDERDRHVVLLRFVEDRSQREIGELLGVTQTQVSRLISRILRDLRRSLTGELRAPVVALPATAGRVPQVAA